MVEKLIIPHLQSEIYYGSKTKTEMNQKLNAWITLLKSSQYFNDQATCTGKIKCEAI